MTHPGRGARRGHPSRNRLGILAVLAEADYADFASLKDALDLTDGNLSRRLQVLEEAGFVIIEKEFQGRRPRTMGRSTRRGRKALRDHLQAMQDLIDRVNKEKK